MKLAPHCQVMFAFADSEVAGDKHLSIEFLRACCESTPTYPEAWTPEEGRDYAAMYCAA